MKKLWQRYCWLVLALCAVVAIPLILFLVVKKSPVKSAWLDFWGAYLGSIVTIAFAYINTQVSAKEQAENLKLQLEQSKQNDLDNAIKLDRMKRLFSLIDYSDIVKQTFKNAKFEIIMNTKRSTYDKLEFTRVQKMVKDLDFFIQKANNIFYIIDADSTIDLTKISQDLLSFKINDLLLVQYLENKIKKQTTAEKVASSDAKRVQAMLKHISQLKKDYAAVDQEVRTAYKQETQLNLKHEVG